MKFTTKRTLKSVLRNGLVITALLVCGVSFSTEASEKKDLDPLVAQSLGTLIQLSEETYYRCDDERVVHILAELESIRDSYNMSSGAKHSYLVGQAKIKKTAMKEFYTDSYAFCQTYPQYLQQIALTIVPEYKETDLSVQAMNESRKATSEKKEKRRAEIAEKQKAAAEAERKEAEEFEKLRSQCTESKGFRRAHMDQCLEVCSEHYSMWCEDLSQEKRQLESSIEQREKNGVVQIAEGIKSLF
ncbi:hypothetical protein [Vibrio phage Va2]|nr:hypothetical protein [Vibrio phage Va2]